MVNHDIELDVKKRTGAVPASVTVRVGDTGSQTIRANLTNGGAKFEPGGTARLDILKADGTWCRCVASINGSVAECTLPPEALSSPGTARLAHFVFVDGDEATSTEGINLRVLPNVDVSDADSEAENYDDQLQKLYEKWLAFEQQSESDFEEAQTDRQSAYEAAEGARDDSYEEAEGVRDGKFETAEARRDAAQEANDEAQSSNDASQAKNNSDQAANNASAQGLVAVILGDGEYDTDTLEPTIDGAVGKMYLVPLPQAQTMAMALPMKFALASNEDGTYTATAAEAADGDVYVEWLWINATWERIGLSTATIDPITTDQIDAVCSDSAPQGKQVLNLTGLSYLWAKVKAWATGAFAALSHTHPASQVTGLTASRALVSDSSGHPAASAVTATELGYLDGVKSGVQGQIDALGDSLSRTARYVRLLRTTTPLEPGESTTVDGITSFGFALVLAYSSPNGFRSAVLMPTGNSVAAVPGMAGAQGIRVQGDVVTAISSNTEKVTVTHVFGVVMP